MEENKKEKKKLKKKKYSWRERWTNKIKRYNTYAKEKLDEQEDRLKD